MRFVSSSTCVSRAFSRASASCAPAVPQASARTSAMRSLERIAQAGRDAARVAAARRRRRADAVLAEVAQAAGLVAHLGELGDEVEVLVEEILVGERVAVAARLLGAGEAAVLRLAVRGDPLVHAEGAGQVDHAGLLVVGAGA